MPVDQIQGAGLARLSLDHDFGHSPVGSLGGRSVQQVGAGAPRLAQARPAEGGFFAKVQALGNRVLDALTPHGVRAEGKFRRALEETGAQVGNLLGALSKTQGQGVDSAGAKKLIDGLRETAQPMTSRGAKFDDVFAARVGLNVGQMGTAQLLALRDGLAEAQAGALKDDPQVAGQLKVIDTAVAKELGLRTQEQGTRQLAPLVQKALGEVAREGEAPGAVAYQYSRMMDSAGSVLRANGQPRPTEAQQRSLVVDTLNQMMASGDIDEAGVRSILSNVSSKEQLAIVESAPLRDSPVEPPLRDAVSIAVGCVMERRDQAQAGALSGADKVLAHKPPVVDDPKGPLHDPRGFAREVIDVAGQLTRLREHSGVHGLPLDARIDPKAGQLQDHLDGLLKPPNLLVSELNDSQLSKLGTALKQLGVTSGTAEISAEIARRKDEAQAEYTAALKTACDCAGRGDLTGLLRGIEQAQGKANEAVTRLQRLNDKGVSSGNDDVMKMRNQLMTKALEGMSVEQLGTLFGALNQPDARMLVAATGLVGHGLLDSHHDVGHQMFNASVDLELMGNLVEDALKAKGVSLPPMPDETRYTEADLSPKVRAAVLEVYGVEIQPGTGVNVKIGVGSEALQEALGANIEGMQAKAPREFVLEGDVGSGVEEGMWKDIGRASYNVRTPDGVSHALVDRTGWNNLPGSEQTARRQGGVELLLGVAGGDKDLVLRASKYANQNVLAGIQMAMMGPDSPIRLPDGTPGRLVGPEHMSYNMSSDGEGGLLLRCDYSISDATHFMDPATGQMHKLEPGSGKAHFTFEMRFGADGRVEVSEPVQFLYDLKVDTWTKDYPKPKTMGDVVGTPALLADFRAFVGPEHIEENVDFMVELDAFSKAPTLEGARALSARFIGASAPDYINIPDSQSNAIRAALSGPGAGALTGEQLVALFAAPKKEVDGMLTLGPLARFVKLNSGE